MSKVVIFPGVGLHEDEHKYDSFLDTIRASGFDVEVNWWRHSWPLPSFNVDVSYNIIRKWAYEVILDFQQVVRHAFTMQVPEADYYIGHSAGSVVALAQSKPAITFGSPAILVEILNDGQRLDNGSCDELPFQVMFREANTNKKIFNVINTRDVLAYPLYYNGVENYYYSGPWWKLSTYNPVTAHTEYWEDKKVAQKMVERLQQWEKE